MSAGPTTAAFLPGASGRGEFWAPVAMRLNSVEQVFFDWPGFEGVPSDPAVAGYSDLASLVVERLRDRPSVLVAQSMGGVARVHADAVADQIRALLGE